MHLGGMHERIEERREHREERTEQRADRHQQHGRHGYGDNSELEADNYDSRNRHGDRYSGGPGTTASQGFGNQSSYRSGTTSGGYNPSYISPDSSRPTTNEPSNRYSGGDNEDYSNRPRMSHDKPQGYGANPTYGSAGDPSPAYSSGYASGGQTHGAPGAGGTETRAPADRFSTPSGQAPGGAEGYVPTRDQYSSRPGQNDEGSDSRYGGSRNSADEPSGRKSYEQYGASSNAPGDGGYSSGGPPRGGVEQSYGGRDASYKSSEPEYGSKGGSGYKAPGSEYGAKSGSGYGASQAYGGRQGGGENDKHPGSTPDSDSYGAESQSGYNAPKSDGGPRRGYGDTDEYRGKKGSGYQTSEQDTYGSKNGAGYNASQSYGVSRCGDGDEPSGRTSQYSGTSGGGNAPSGGFLSGSGDASRRDDSEPGTNSNYGGRDSGYGGYNTGGRGGGTAEPPYGSNTSSGYDAPGRDQGTYSGTQTQGPPRRSDHGDMERDPRYKQHFDAHAQAYGPGANSNAPMDSDVIGAAAAVEALKLTAAGNQPQEGGGGRRPNSGYDNSEYSNAPSGGLTPNKPAGGQKPSYDEDSAPPASKGGMQDKMVALAMSQASKLFDKKNSGSSGGSGDAGKAQATQSAAATAMQLFSEYSSTGKVDTAKVVGAAMSLF